MEMLLETNHFSVYSYFLYLGWDAVIVYKNLLQKI